MYQVHLEIVKLPIDSMLRGCVKVELQRPEGFLGVIVEGKHKLSLSTQSFVVEIGCEGGVIVSELGIDWEVVVVVASELTPSDHCGVFEINWGLFLTASTSACPVSSLLGVVGGGGFGSG